MPGILGYTYDIFALLLDKYLLAKVCQRCSIMCGYSIVPVKSHGNACYKHTELYPLRIEN